MSDRRSRREFMGLSLVGAAGALTPSLLTASPAHVAPLAVDPDLIVTNAKVYTMDSTVPRADAFAVSNSRFVAIGTSAAMKALAGRRTQMIDAKGMTVVPGFIDTHNHAGGTTLLYEVRASRGMPYIRANNDTNGLPVKESSAELREVCGGAGYAR